MTDTSVLLSGLSYVGYTLLAPDVLLVSAITFVVWKVYISIYICL
jgi:hypothetical protein